MGTAVQRKARRDQTQRELDRLKRELAEWLGRCRKYKAAGLLKSRLDALEGVLATALNGIQEALDKATAADAETGQLYRRCRRLDGRIAWTRRAWDYFRRKLDQRNDPKLADLLLAADEVAWSAFSAPFEANGREPDQPSPLPFVEPHPIPQAFHYRPEELATNNSQLAKLIETLPIPLVGLPPECTHAPWWLASVAHEVGHHVQYRFAEKRHALLGDFDAKLKQAVQAEYAKLEQNGAPELTESVKAVAARWEGWGAEVFADLFSLAVLGEPAAWTLAEFVRTGPDDAWKGNHPDYPAPAVRLAIAAEACRAFGLEYAPTLDGWRPDPEDAPTDEVRLHLALAPGVLERIVVAPLETLGTMKNLATKVAPADEAATFDCYEKLLDKRGFIPDKHEDATRLVMASSVHAWAQVLGGDADEVDTSRERLCANLKQALIASRRSKLRAADNAIDVAGAGAAFLRQLDAAERAEPGGPA